LGDLPSEVIVGALATVAVGLLAAAIAASADVLARAWVTVARERYSIEKTGASLAVRVPSLSPNPISVITARWDATEEKTWYLVKEPGVSPVWIREDEVKGWLSQTLDS
jgi:hypothetical protein